MLATSLLALSLLTPRAQADTIRLAEVQSLFAYHRPGIRLILAHDDTTARLAITVREPQHFETTVLTLTDAARRDSMPMAVLHSDSSSIDARSDPPTHTLWYRVDLLHLRFWAAAGSPGIRVGRIKYTLEPKGAQRMRAAVGREGPAVQH